MSAAVAVLHTEGEEKESASTPDFAESKKRLEPENAIIFDWDDTLLCSTWLAAQGLRLDEPVIPAEAQEHLMLLEDSVCLLLNTALSYGPVSIITNAERGWVELSAKKFVPAVVPLLSHIRVFSARSTFESRFPCPSEWKVQAFSEELLGKFDGLPPSYPKNALSFGDSAHERTAIHRVAQVMVGTQTKSIKFVERPSAEQLKRQVDLVQSCFGEIVSHEGNLDLMLTIQQLHSTSQ